MMGAIRSLLGRSRRVVGDERGFTVVEGVVAAMILVIGVLGTLQLFDAGTRNTFRAEESQVVNDRLQAELEAIRQLPYGEVGLTSQPVHSVDSDDPRWRVSGTQYALARNGSSLAQMVFNGGTKPGGSTVSGGAVDPGPTPFEAGDVSGTIHRFVTWTSDPSCPECGTGAMKRVIVAATIDDAAISGGRVFQEVHTDVVDPDVVPDDNPPPPDPEDPGTTTVDFWLTDTTCNNSARIQPTASHLTHNTRGVCSQGLQTGSTRGAPDLMYIEAPAQVDVPAGQPQPTFDYATDSEAADPLYQDIGLMSPWASNDSCMLSPVLNTLDVKRLLEGLLSILNLPALPAQLDGILDITAGDADKHKRIHTWVSPRIQGSGGVLLGRGTLDLYTKTINGAVHPGQICAWLSVRQSVTIPAQLCVLVCIPLGSTTIEVDLPYVNVGLLSSGECRTGTGLNLTNFQHSQNPWPTEWTKISVPLCFAAVNVAGAVVPAVLPPNSRVVLSVMVKKGGTEPGQGLEFMYDAVGYESRLHLATNQILQF